MIFQRARLKPPNRNARLRPSFFFFFIFFKMRSVFLCLPLKHPHIFSICCLFPIGSMVLLYMVTWIPSIYPSHVSIYSSTMDPSWVCCWPRSHSVAPFTCHSRRAPTVPSIPPPSLRRRSDKRPDRVEIAPEQLVEAVEYAEKLSQAKMGELGRTLKLLDI